MRLSSVSLEYVPVTVTADADPTGDVVQMAFPPRREEPAEGDWGTASWVPGGPPWQAQALAGLGGDFGLGPGRWDVWVRVDDGTEIPARRAGVLTVTPLPAGLGPDVDDVIRALGRELGSSEVDACELVLDQVVGDAEGVLLKTLVPRQVVESVVVDVWGIAGVGGAPYYERGTSAVLSRGPVASIDAVSYRPYDNSGVKTLAAGDWTQDGAAVLLNPGVSGEAEVTYTTRGLDAAALASVGGVVVQRTARLMNKRKDDVVGTQTSSVEGSSVTYLDDEWTEAELKTLRRRRRLAVV